MHSVYGRTGTLIASRSFMARSPSDTTSTCSSRRQQPAAARCTRRPEANTCDSTSLRLLPRSPLVAWADAPPPREDGACRSCADRCIDDHTTACRDPLSFNTSRMAQRTAGVEHPVSNSAKPSTGLWNLCARRRQGVRKRRWTRVWRTGAAHILRMADGLRSSMRLVFCRTLLSCAHRDLRWSIRFPHALPSVLASSYACEMCAGRRGRRSSLW